MIASALVGALDRVARTEFAAGAGPAVGALALASSAATMDSTLDAIAWVGDITVIARISSHTAARRLLQQLLHPAPVPSPMTTTLCHRSIYDRLGRGELLFLEDALGAGPVHRHQNARTISVAAARCPALARLTRLIAARSRHIRVHIG